MAKGERITYEKIIEPGILERIKNEIQDIGKSVESAFAGKAGGKAIKETTEAVEDLVDASKDLFDLQKIQLRLDKEIEDITNKLDKAVNKKTKRYAELSKTLTELKVVREQNTRELKTEAKFINNVAGSMNQLSQALAKNKLEYRKLNKEERENKKVGGQLLKTIKKQDDQIKKLDKTLGDNQRSVGDYGKAVNAAGSQFGILGTAMNQMRGAFNVVKLGFRSVKAAMASTGILAIVLAIISLVKWFKNTAVGAEKLRKILVPLKAIFGTITSTLQNIGSGLSKIFSGDFTGGINEMRNAVKGVADELERQLIFEERLADLHTISWQHRVQNLERIRQLEAEAAEQRKIAMDDANVSLKDQLIAIGKSKAALTEIRNIKEQQRAFEAEQLGIQINAGEQSEDTLLRLAEVNSQQGVIQKSFETQMITLTGRMNTLLNKQTADEIKAIKQVTEIRVKGFEEQRQTADEFFAEEEILLGKELDLFIKNEEEKSEAAKKNAQLRIGLEQMEYDAKVSIMNSGFEAAQQLFKENAAASKAIATAQATINTFLAATQALAAYPPPFSFVAMAATIAAGLVQVLKINDVSFAEGTESVEGGTPGKDSVNALLMPKERVVPVDINRKLMGIPNEQLPGLVNMALNQNKSNAELQILSQIAHQGNTTNKYLKGGLKWMDAQGAIHDVDGNIVRYLN